jgi:Phage portal protein, lambda family
VSFFGRIFSPGKEQRRLRMQTRRFRYLNKISAGAKAPGQAWPGIPTQDGDDSLNREYIFNLATIQSRAQDNDINQPDLHGFHRTRTAQVVGKGVSFKHQPQNSEVGVGGDDSDALLEVTKKVNRIREIHSRLGGFDAQGLGRSEGKQQERAVLTAFVLGGCLIHRVWRKDARYPLPLSIELIPASRISTPYNRYGDPLISFGVEYSDEHRSRVVGWHIRRVSKSIGNSFVQDFEWDFVPVEDGSLLSLTEIAGIDRALPLSTSTTRLLRNRGEFVEASVESARAQSQYYAVTQCAPDADPYNSAGDDAAENASENLSPFGFVNIGGVKMLYNPHGETTEWASAKLPEPNAESFYAMTDERLARGLVSSLSRFTRKVNSSWAGGRLEDQQDDPIIDQYRDAFVAAWERVNEWFLDAVWLTNAVELPGYNAKTRVMWCEFRAQFPGRVHINPVQTMQARSISLALRNTSPQRIAEEDGHDLRETLREWGQAVKICRQTEKEFGLEDGELDFLLEGRYLTTSAGEQVTDKPEQEPPPDDAKNRMQQYFQNKLREVTRG